jgi:hypothetical protein
MAKFKSNIYVEISATTLAKIKSKVKVKKDKNTKKDIVDAEELLKQPG